MMPDVRPSPVRRVLLVGVAVVLVPLLGLLGWFLTRPISPGVFVVRVVPARGTAGGLLLSLFGPGGEKLGEWPFQEAPGPAALKSLEKKVPWEAVATKASTARPCLVLQVGRTVPETAVAPVLALARSQCCPGQTDFSACPVRRVMVQH